MNITFTWAKKSDPSPDQEELYRTTQQRVDLLVSYFRKADGAVEAQELVVKAYKDLDLTPGFTLIDNGFYRAAYRDDVTGQVIKIPLNVRFDKQEMNVVTVNEQKSYALIDLDDLKAEKIEYVETHFYTPTEHSQYPVVVQPYLDPDEYKPVKDLATEFYLSKVALKPGIWDTHVGNARVKTDGTVVLFDCLDINET